MKNFIFAVLTILASSAAAHAASHQEGEVRVFTEGLTITATGE